MHLSSTLTNPHTSNMYGPLGISTHVGFNHYYPGYSNYTHKVEQNTVEIFPIAGIGIKSGNGDDRLTVSKNFVQFFTNNAVSGTVGYKVNELVGYWNENCHWSLFHQNTTLGCVNQAVWEQDHPLLYL